MVDADLQGNAAHFDKANAGSISGESAIRFQQDRVQCIACGREPDGSETGVIGHPVAFQAFHNLRNFRRQTQSPNSAISAALCMQ
jgi:hypothetical protein